MKKSLLITALLFWGFLGFGQNKMPYYIMYQMDGDTIYRSLQSVSSININSDRQQLIHSNGTDLIPLSGADTVCIFRDKFRKYVGEMADWDEVLFSMEQIHFYKENSNGQPLALFSFYINDSIPDGYFIYTEFDEEGNPEYTNFNDTCVVIVSEVYEDYFNAVVIDSDMSSFSIDSVPLGDLNRIYGLRAWQDLTLTERAVYRRMGYMGGINMAMGGVGILVGCSMLIPGVNVAVGATLVLAGTLTFVSGELLATRATDKMLSDGTHTDGFEESARLFGWAGSIVGVAASPYALISVVANLAYLALNEGLSAVDDHLRYPPDDEALQAAIERAQQIRNMELSATGRATLLDVDSHTVRLFGNVTNKLDSNDWFGILVCKDKEALTIDYCQPLDPSHPTGSFYCDFSGLEPCEGYYYRSYYYSHELGNLGFNPEVVSTLKSFKMPGVITLEHEHGNSSNSYWLHGKFQDVADQPTHTVGFCYSYTNEEPTYDDETIQQTVYDNGEFTGHLFCDNSYETCFYRAYAFIDGEIAYGEVRQINNTVVTTYEVTNITSTSATGGGEVSSLCEVTERGICWSTSQNPTISNSHAASGWGTGSFTVNMTGLTPNTTYHVRAYAKIGNEYYYGEDKSFYACDCNLTSGDWVDLGLPSGLLWATRNVGASSPTDYGCYFAWGEIHPKSVYNLDTYRYYDRGEEYQSSDDGYTKYCDNSDYGYCGYTDNLTTLQSGDDAATVNYGGRMPTKEECLELNNYTTSSWVTINGVNGRCFTGPNGNSLFLPAAGYRLNSSLDTAGSYGFYWSSSLYSGGPDGAWGLGFYSGYCRMSYVDRVYGFAVRPVRSSRQD